MLDSLKPELKKGFLPVALLFFMAMVIRVAWVTEDAFISFRAIDNLLKGNGLVYNVGERVQVFTDPLYCLVLAILSFFTGGEFFYTSIGLSLALTLATALVVAYKYCDNFMVASFTILMLSLSIAFTEFSTSSLENPMSHLLLALFYTYYFLPGKPRIFLLALLAGLSATNRLDSLIYFIFPLAQLILSQFNKRNLVLMLAGFTPFLAWEMFSLIYYGFLVPNTALAKLNLGIDTWTMAEQGVIFLIASVTHDPVTGLLIGLLPVSIFLAAKIPSSRKEYFILAGIGGKLVYIVLVGGDYMLGRFLTDVALASLLVFAQLANRLEWKGGVHALLFVLCLGLAVSVNHSPLRSGLSYGTSEDTKFEWYIEGLVDERAFYYNQTGMANRGRFEKVRNGSVDEALRLNVRHELGDSRVVTMGNAGMLGYYSNPSLHLVDVHALCDPLMARLPLASDYYWRTGHYSRNVPEGYVETIKSGVNQLKDKDLAQFYDHLHLVVSGSIFSMERIKTIVKMNLGVYNHFIDSFLDNSFEATYRHLKRKNGKYHYPFKRLTTPINAGLDANDARVVKFWDHFGSLFLDMDSMSHCRTWTAFLSTQSQVAIRFYKGDSYLGTSNPIPQSADKQGMQPFSILVPQPAWAHGYDRVELVPYTDEKRAAVAFWAPATEPNPIPFHLMYKSGTCVVDGYSLLAQPSDFYALYGPYIALPANRYRLTMDFDRDPDPNFTLSGNVYWNTGNETYANQVEKNPQNGQFVTEFELKKAIPTLEFRYLYQSEKPVPLKITALKLEVL